MDKRLVKVVWLDAENPSEEQSWYSDHEVDDFTADKCEVTSVGWVKSETKLYLTLVSDFFPNGDGSFTWSRPTKIPVGCIVTVEDLVAVVPIVDK